MSGVNDWIRALFQTPETVLTAAEISEALKDVTDRATVAKRLHALTKSAYLERTANEDGHYQYKVNLPAPKRTRKARAAKPAGTTAPATQEALKAKIHADAQAAQSWHLHEHLDAVCGDLEDLVADALANQVAQSEMAALIDLHLMAHRLQRAAALPHLRR